VNKAKKYQKIKNYCIITDEKHLASTVSLVSNRAKLLESRVTFLHFLGCGKALSRSISLGIAQSQYPEVAASTLANWICN